MKIMRATLHTHNEWFKLQMCKDRFEGLLRINSLKEVHAPFLSPVCTSKSYADSCTNGSSQATVSSGTRMSEDGSSPTQVSSRDVICDEGAILKVMVSYGFFGGFWYCLIIFCIATFKKFKYIFSKNVLVFTGRAFACKFAIV